MSKIDVRHQITTADGLPVQVDDEVLKLITADPNARQRLDGAVKSMFVAAERARRGLCPICEALVTGIFFTPSLDVDEDGSRVNVCYEPCGHSRGTLPRSSPLVDSIREG